MNNEEIKRQTKIYKAIAEALNKEENKKVGISRYEYYLLGGSYFANGLSIIYKLLRANEITYSEYEKLKGYMLKEIQIRASRNKEFILMTYYQFGGTVISDEEKNSIWNNLCTIIPVNYIDDLVFSGAVRAYALEKGLIKNKENNDVKKKTLKRK